MMSETLKSFAQTLGLGGLALCSLACDPSSTKSEGGGTKPPSRFEAVTVKKGVSSAEIDGFCDARNVGKLALPELREPAPKAAGPLWVNVWATWCKSCVEEMPMIAEWEEKLDAEVLFISADEEPGALATFRSAHPGFPKTLTMSEPAELSEWMKENRIDAGSGLPLHLFVGADGTILCTRTGAVAERHWPVVESLLK
jgi:thiol-disulfide isomerase/thioredoxin